MKILFALPSGDTVYGSGRCAVQLARASGLQFDLLVGKSLIHSIDEENLREQFGDKLGNIYQLWLPNVDFYYGANKNIFVIFAAIHKYIMWLVQKRKFRKIVQGNRYDVIHLNSMILAPMVDEKYKMILHVREVFEGAGWKRRYIEKKLQEVNAVIYINPSTRNALNDVGVNGVMIQDPFEMQHIAEINASEVKESLGIVPESVVFAILGRYEDRNGTEFIIESFHRTKNEKAVLLVVGGCTEKDQVRARRISEEDQRIRMLGEWKEPGPIFAISDYILRGERFFSGFSRTVYEGLYSGCKIIFPGQREEAVDSFQYDEFKNDITFYPPRDGIALAKIIDKSVEYPVTQRKYRSNRKEYVSEYLELIDWVYSG